MIWRRPGGGIGGGEGCMRDDFGSLFLGIFCILVLFCFFKKKNSIKDNAILS